MENLFEQISNILITPPGNLAYLLVLIFSLVISLQAISGLRITGVVKKRLLLATLLLLVAHILLFLFTAFAWQGVTDTRTYLPSLDRSITTISFIWVAWMWIFPKKNRGIDLITILLSLAVLGLFIFSFTAWDVQQATTSFNNTLLDWSWSVFYTLVIVSAILLTLVQKPVAWGLALLFFNINLVGALSHMLLVSPNSDFSGFLRIAQLCSFPLIPGLIYHHAASKSGAPEAIIPPPNNEALSISDWVEFAGAEKPTHFIAIFTKICSHSLNASSCIWFDGQIDAQIIAWGYNNLSQTPVNRSSLDPQKHRAFIKAASKMIPTKIDLNDLTRVEINQYDQSILGQNGTQQVFLYPIYEKDGRKLGAFVITHTQPDDEFSGRAEKFLNKTQEILIRKFAQSERKEILEGKTEALERELSAAHHQIVRQSEDLKGLRQKMDETSVIAALQVDTEKQIQQLEKENRLLTARLANHSTEIANAALPADEYSQLQLAPIIDEAITNNASLMLENDIILELDIPQNLPALILTPLQTVMLQDMIGSLFSYACKASKENGVLQFTVKQEQQDLLMIQIYIDTNDELKRSSSPEVLLDSELLDLMLANFGFQISHLIDGNQLRIEFVLPAGV